MIEGDPENLNTQNDSYVVSLGTEYAVTNWMSVFGEFYGKFSGEETVRSYMAGGGLRFLVGKSAFYVSGAAGLAEYDPDWTVSVGFMRMWDL